MKLATFIGRNDAPAIGVVDTARGAVLDLAAAARAGGQADGRFADMLSLIDAGEAGLAEAGRLAAAWPGEAAMPLAGLRPLAPLLPRQMRDCLVFEGHLKNGMAQREKRTGVKETIPEVWYRQPIYYKCNRFSVAGPETTVVWPKYSQLMDFELELACVIGRAGKDIPRDRRALDHIFGFTIFNDFSARDAQFAEMAGRLGPAKGKDFDGGNVLGPWIVTRDEIGDPHALDMEVRVNGERWGGGNSGSMHHKFPDILAHISDSETLHAGEVIGSGTVGTGSGNEMGRSLKSGDVVELEIEKIGVLRNTVVRP